MLNIYKTISKTFIHCISEFETLNINRNNYNTKNSDFIIFIQNPFRNLSRTEALWRRAWTIGLNNNKVPFRLTSNIDNLRQGQTVIWYPNQISLSKDFQFNKKGSDKLIEIANRIEDKGGILFPDSKACSFQENKINMHTMFEEQNIPTPNTFIVTNKEEFENAIGNLKYPIIIKGPYSNNSQHLDCIKNEKDADIMYQYFFEQKVKMAGPFPFTNRSLPIIIQQFIDLKRDMRVTFVGGKILDNCTYWRTNQGTEWTSTATRFGAIVNFEPIPPQWVNFIESLISKFKMPWGGIDLTWEDDDFNSPPIILEVSPIFGPNPPIPKSFNKSYHQFKYGMNLQNNWHYHYWKIIKEIGHEQINYILKAKTQ